MDCYRCSFDRLHRHAEITPLGHQGESLVSSALLQAANLDQYAGTSVSVLGYRLGHDLLCSPVLPVRQGRWCA